MNRDQLIEVEEDIGIDSIPQQMVEIIFAGSNSLSVNGKPTGLVGEYHRNPGSEIIRLHSGNMVHWIDIYSIVTIGVKT